MFSIIALVWRPGQITRIHDHVTWCVFGVVQGVEHEDPTGVHNTAGTTAISIHIYGTDVSRIRSSVRRYHD